MFHKYLDEERYPQVLALRCRLDLPYKRFPEYGDSLIFLNLLYCAYLHFSYIKLYDETYPDRDAPLVFIMAHPSYHVDFGEDRLKLYNQLYTICALNFENCWEDLHDILLLIAQEWGKAGFDEFKEFEYLWQPLS